MLLSNDFFKWTLVVSIIFHLIIVLGISFVMPVQAEKSVVGPPLKITLVTNLSDLAPEESNTLAQANSLGEEDAETAIPDTNIQTPKQNQSQPTLESGNTDNFVSKKNDNASLSSETSKQQKPKEEVPLTREQLAENINLAYMNAQSKPREKYVSARSKENKYAAYIEKWRLLVERVGNLNYPEAAKQQKLEGTLILDVAISANGKVDKVRVLESSGHKILDDAAERIVYIAAPFDRFPESIHAEVDTLHIVRTWEFGQDTLISRNIGGQ